MTFQQAARIQHNRHSFYVVFLVGPAGDKVRLGRTQRKTGTGLMRFLGSDSVQSMLLSKFGQAEMEEMRFKKSATALTFSNGWKIEFGGTIREEAQEEPPCPS